LVITATGGVLLLNLVKAIILMLVFGALETIIKMKSWIMLPKAGVHLLGVLRIEIVPAMCQLKKSKKP
jgi:hypothetical protein